MAIEKVYLDPNAAAYTDDQIVGKVNTAAVNITRAGSIEGSAASALSSDDIGEGATNKYDTGEPPASTDELAEGAANKYDTGVPLTAIQTKDAIVAMADDDREIIISRPAPGQKKVYAIQTHTDAKQEIEQSDTPEA